LKRNDKLKEKIKDKDMPTYIDLLPEEIIQLIWRYIYNDNLDRVITCSFWKDQHPQLRRLTVSIKKRKGYYYDILKNKYNVVLFNREFNYMCSLQHYEKMFIRYRRLRATNGLTESCDCGINNKLRGSAYYNKKDLREMLRLNGYKLYDGRTSPYIHTGTMYESWTRNRLLKELMSL
jgi:hypothetical protein